MSLSVFGVSSLEVFVPFPLLWKRNVKVFDYRNVKKIESNYSHPFAVSVI